MKYKLTIISVNQHGDESEDSYLDFTLHEIIQVLEQRKYNPEFREAIITPY